MTVDLDHYTQCSVAYHARTGRLLTLHEYLALYGEQHEAAALSAEQEKDRAEYIDEMSLGGTTYDPDAAPATSIATRRD